GAPEPAAPAAGPPLTGAMLALLAPGSAAAALHRAEVRLQAAGVTDAG
ncbi:MAG: hypothetical protein JWM85_2843, partial [Acidimicrobiaceae bacterium]|nr:hypothetical protein [Acidimicrobiaceae bacterium]